MKKFITLVLLICITMTTVLPTTALAKTGDIIGHAKYTDISAYINHYPITSYNINDYTAVVAEDLANYGFNVEWNGENRSLSITKNDSAAQITPYGTIYKYSIKAGQNSFPYLETDIVTYVNGNKVESFNINGKTCIYMDSLAPYGDVVWVPEIRAIKMWIDNLPVIDYAPVEEAPLLEQLGLTCYDGTELPVYDKATGSTFDYQTESTAFYKIDSPTYWYKSSFESIEAYQNLLKQCGWEYDGTKFNRETQIVNNTIKQVPTSFRAYYKKGDIEVSLHYFYKTGNLALHFHSTQINY